MPETVRILIIDDEKDVRKIVKKRLTAYGFEVLEANDGFAGLELAKQEIPDLILLDIMMPIQDGVETYHLLRKEETTKKIPVIFLTALSIGNGSLDALNSEDRDYGVIGKPYDPQKLLLEIQRMLGRTKQSSQEV